MSNDPFENDAVRRAREALENGFTREVRESLADRSYTRILSDEFSTRTGTSAFEGTESASNRLFRDHLEKIAPSTQSFTSELDRAVERSLADQHMYLPEETAAARRARELLEAPGARSLFEVEQAESHRLHREEMLTFRRQSELEVIRPVVDRILSDDQFPNGFLSELNARVRLARPEIPSLARLKDNIDGILDRQREIQRRIDDATEPFLSASRSLSQAISAIVPPFPTSAVTHHSWEANLEFRLGGLHTSWLSPDASASLSGFGRMARLGQALRYDNPFSPAVVDLFDDEFGGVVEQEGEPEERDEAAVEEGLNTDLVAFRAESYGFVIARAGFEVSLPTLVVPKAIENADQSAVFDNSDNLFIGTLENRMRHFLMVELDKLEGGQKRHVPGQIMGRWKGRQQEARDEGGAVYEPIWYADFMDMSQIIDGKLVYAAVGPILGRQDDVRTAFHRLHPIRKALAHGRPIGNYDRLVMTVEVTRLLTALGHRVLQ